MRLAQSHLNGVARVPRLPGTAQCLYRGYKIPKKKSRSKPIQYRKNSPSTLSATNIFRQPKLTTYNTRPFFKCTIILLLIGPKSVLACYGDYGDYDWHEVTTPKHPLQVSLDISEEIEKLNISKIKNPVDRNKMIGWGGWTPPPTILNDWKLWLHNFEMKNNDSDFHDVNQHGKNVDAERGHASDWPNDWLDAGHGFGGVAPPPWAYVPKVSGKRELCLLAPRRGKCAENLTRWGYNPYLDQCMNFTWSGCGGNQNNFEKKLRCEEECMAPPPSGCDSDSHILLTDLNS